MSRSPSIRSLVTVVNDWYAANARDLPWRRPGVGAWGVLVSEVMLQQTPVRRVEPVWAAWLARWPQAAALAADTPGAAVRAWGRLGYPRRALRLHEAARVITERHAGTVPDDLDSLLALPGVGAYTARAVACFGYGHAVPVVDTNVRRFVARAVGGQAEPGPPSTSRDLAAVQALLPKDPDQAARFGAAAMELGALVCTARNPRCAHCPVRPLCRWQQRGAPAYAGPVRRGPGFAGTDRQVRGLLLEVIRSSPGPVGRPALDLVWPEPKQRARALAGLVADGLVARTTVGAYALPEG